VNEHGTGRDVRHADRRRAVSPGRRRGGRRANGSGPVLLDRHDPAARVTRPRQVRDEHLAGPQERVVLGEHSTSGSVGRCRHSAVPGRCTRSISVTSARAPAGSPLTAASVSCGAPTTSIAAAWAYGSTVSWQRSHGEEITSSAPKAAMSGTSACACSRPPEVRGRDSSPFFHAERDRARPCRTSWIAQLSSLPSSHRSMSAPSGARSERRVRTVNAVVTSTHRCSSTSCLEGLTLRRAATAASCAPAGRAAQ
jgi:hypothetical protein